MLLLLLLLIIIIIIITIIIIAIIRIIIIIIFVSLIICHFISESSSFLSYSSHQIYSKEFICSSSSQFFSISDCSTYKYRIYSRSNIPIVGIECRKQG